jgi:hypothetical protein
VGGDAAGKVDGRERHYFNICAATANARGADGRRAADTVGVQTELIATLQSRRVLIRARWSDLLHADRASTPLADPGTLVHLLDWTLDEIFSALRGPSPPRVPPMPRGMALAALCPCGRNPLLLYFHVGQQAMQEALVLSQAAQPLLDPAERDASLLELQERFAHIARREIATFCGVCQYRLLDGINSAGAKTEITLVR